MKLGWSLILYILFFTPTLHAIGKVDITETHGLISLGIGTGYANYRVMNSDGTWAGYRGFTHNGTLEIRVLNMENSAISIFGDYSWGQTSESSIGGATLEHKASCIGLRFYPTKGFFAGFGLGTGSEKLSENGVDVTLKHSFNKISLGFEWGFSSDWAMGFQGHYKSGPISREENPQLSSNSSFEGLEGLVLLIWSPSSLNFFEKSGR